MKSVIFRSVLVLAAIFNAVSAIKICGLERLKRCNPYNKTCIINDMEPSIRHWFAHGRPDYFENPIDPLYYEDLTIPVEDGSYQLSNIKIKGIGNSYLSDWIFDEGSNGLGVMGYTYNFNLEVTAESVSKSCESSKSGSNSGPITVKLGHIKSYTKLPLWFTTRCNGEKYMAMKDDYVIIEHANNTISGTCGKVEECDQKTFEYNLAETVVDIASRFLTEGFRVFCTQIELNGYFDLNPPKPSKPCHPKDRREHYEQSSSSSSSSSSCTRESTRAYTETYVKRFSDDK